MRFVVHKFRYIPRIEFRAAILAIVTGLVLLALKFCAYFITGSTAVYSDAMETIVNVLASVVAFWSLFVAHQPPDEDHPYGHGKIEFMSAAFEGGMILIAAALIVVQAIDQILHRDFKIEKLDVGLLLVVVATLINAFVGLLLLRIGRKQNSLTLHADGVHLITDVVTSVVVLIALTIVHFTGMTWADPIFALGIAVYITISGVGLLRKAAAGLMDQQDFEDHGAIRTILNSHAKSDGPTPHICSYHKLRHRHTGRYHWVDFHMQVPATLTIAEAHGIASVIEYEIEKLLGEGNATAHIEPCDNPDCRMCRGA